MVDTFETADCGPRNEAGYVPTAKVLQHFDHEINTVLGGVEGDDGSVRQVRIVLLAGADLLMSMSKASRSVMSIMGRFHYAK